MDLQKYPMRNLKSSLIVNSPCLQNQELLSSGVKRKMLTGKYTKETFLTNKLHGLKVNTLPSNSYQSEKICTDNRLLSGNSQSVLPCLYNKSLLISTKTPLNAVKLSKVEPSQELMMNKMQKEEHIENKLLFISSYSAVPGLFNKSLLISSITLDAKPNLFATNLIIPSKEESSVLPQKVKAVTTPTAKEKTGKQLERKGKKINEKVTRKRKKDARKEVKDKLDKSNFNQPIYDLNFADDLKDPELEEIREKIRSEKENIFVENKDESDIKRLEKEKINAEKVCHFVFHSYRMSLSCK